ncbi:MAG: bestrophin family ion channel [Cryomorphaceae bacterium]
MYIEKKYGFWRTFNWSKTPFILGTLYSAVVCSLIYFLEIETIIPWQPITLIGIAVAFYLGFKNNSSYDRTWEARKIWGSIVNNSRTFGAATVAFVQGDKQEAVKKELIYRHIAWLTACRFQLRRPKPWEHDDLGKYVIPCPETEGDYTQTLTAELRKYLSQSEVAELMNTSNRATQILKKQSIRLQELRDEELFEDFRHMEFHQLITSFYADQGKAERIKGFPFPRQYASVALWLTLVFAAFVPIGMVNMVGDEFFKVCVLTPLLSGLIIWVFFLMEKIGDYSENPFEGSYNDVPITNIARTIEIDMREMINDSDIPEPTKEIDGFLV